MQLQALLLTWLIEVPLLCWLLRPSSRLYVIAAGLAASLVTHPVAWWAASLLSPHDYTRGLWTIEACVWITEALIFWVALPIPPKRALLASGLANGASFLVGGWLLS